MCRSHPYFLAVLTAILLAAPLLHAQNTLEETLTNRRREIAADLNNPQRWSWLADQANDLHFKYLAQDGLGLTALFGVPSPEQAERFSAAAREMHECAVVADSAVRQAIADLEATPGFAGDAALQSQRRELADIQRDRRIPYLIGIASVLLAQGRASAPADQRRLWEQADRSFSRVMDNLEGAAAREARLFAGLAKAGLGAFDEAESHFATVARDADAAVAHVFMARMGGVINRTIRGGPQAGLEALDSIEPRYAAAQDRVLTPADSTSSSDVFFRMLIIDHRFLLRRSLADSTDQTGRAAALVFACAAYTDVLKSEPRLSREALRAIVLDKLAVATASFDDAMIRAIGGLALVARADRLARDHATRAAAIELLESSVQTLAMDADSRAAALFVLGRALYDHGQKLLAAQRFIQLAVHHPTDVQAQRAVELGVTIAGELRSVNVQDTEALTLYREGLSVLLDRYANLPSIDRWRLAAGLLALDESRFDDAVTLLENITPDAPEWIDAHFMQVAIARGRALTANASGGASDPNARRMHEQTLTVIDRVQPILLQAKQQATDAARSQAFHDSLGLLRIYRAEAQVHLNQPHLALQTLENIEQENFGSGVISEALRVRINSYQALNRPDDALHELQRFVQTSPQQTAAVLLPMLASMQRDVEEQIEQGRDDEAKAESGRTLLPAAQILEQWLDARQTTDAVAAMGRTRIAWAYLHAGQHADALARFDALLTAAPNQADLLLGKAESFFALGSEPQLAEAMNIYKRLASSANSAVIADGGPSLYWLSHLRMLQIIDRVNRNTEQILPRIERLRQQDATFGGERYRRGLESLRQKYSATRPG